MAKARRPSVFDRMRIAYGLGPAMFYSAWGLTDSTFRAV